MPLTIPENIIKNNPGIFDIFRGASKFSFRLFRSLFISEISIDKVMELIKNNNKGRTAVLTSIIKNPRWLSSNRELQASLYDNLHSEDSNPARKIRELVISSSKTDRVYKLLKNKDAKIAFLKNLISAGKLKEVETILKTTTLSENDYKELIGLVVDKWSKEDSKDKRDEFYNFFAQLIQNPQIQNFIDINLVEQINTKKSNNGDTLLIKAIKSNDIHTVQAMSRIDGFNPMGLKNETCPFLLALDLAQIDIIKVLVGTSKFSLEGISLTSVSKYQKSLIQLLQICNFPLDFKQKLFMQAASEGAKEIIEFLMKDCNFNTQTNFKNIVLNAAIFSLLNNHALIARALAQQLGYTKFNCEIVTSLNCSNNKDLCYTDFKGNTIGQSFKNAKHLIILKEKQSV